MIDFIYAILFVWVVAELMGWPSYDPWSEKCPELVGFTPLYGSTELYDSDI